MRVLPILVLLLFGSAVAGCADAEPSFSCRPAVGSFRIDADLYTRPATREDTGYLHC